MKITILWAKLANYSVAFFRELANVCNVEIQLVYSPAFNDAPYNNFDLSFCSMVINNSSWKNRDQLETLVTEFSPHCVLMSSWNFARYMYLARKLKQKGVFIISTIDHQWEGRLKQYLGAIVSPWYLKPCLNTFLVAGDRQAAFARRLGFDDLLYGLYAADISKFSDNTPIINRPRNFLFIGRLVSVKGINFLVEAYRHYREFCDMPWGLKIVGTGKLEEMLKNVPGIEYVGVRPTGSTTPHYASCSLFYHT